VTDVKQYKQWLKKKLKKHKITDEYLVCVAMALARIVAEERSKATFQSSLFVPFYRIYSVEDGKKKYTRAWFYIAELAIWIKYSGYPFDPWVRSVLQLPRCRRALKSNKPISLSTIQPSTRVSTKRLREYEDNFVKYCKERGIPV